MATPEEIKRIHGDYFDRMYLALDQSARLLGVDTTNWMTSSGENASSGYDHDDYDEFNHQMNYLLSVEARSQFNGMFREKVECWGHGLDSIDTAELFLEFVKLARQDGVALPTADEISTSVQERTYREWKGCGGPY